MLVTTLKIRYELPNDEKVMKLVREFISKLERINVTCKGDDIVTVGGPANDYSVRLNSTILRITPKLDGRANKALQALKDLGPSCFSQTAENEEQAIGAIRLLEWIETYLDSPELSDN